MGFALAALLWALNSSWLCGAPGRRPLLLAHRGLAQTFPIAGLSGDTDTSKIIYPPEHPFLENTIASMEAAFRAGADIVELDVQRTADGRFAVFHDATLEFRTDGQGPIRARTLESLKTLDVGFGYSADGGKTFPFRGKGVGLMPSFDEVLARFPEREFLIDMKTGDAEDGAALLGRLPREPGTRFSYSNSNYSLLGLVVGQVSGQDYAEYLRQHVFAPAGLFGTRHCPDAQNYPRATPGYERDSGQLRQVAPFAMANAFAAGGLCSSVGDLVRWSEALSSGKVLAPASYTRMRSETLLKDGQRSAYGFGLSLSELAGHPCINHSGGIDGFVSLLAYYRPSRSPPPVPS